MKLKRILAIPFTIAADIATLGNVGDTSGSFTGRLFDEERREQRAKEDLDALKALGEFIRNVKD